MSSRRSIPAGVSLVALAGALAGSLSGKAALAADQIVTLAEAQTNDLGWARVTELYSTPPDLDHCRPGVLRDTVRQALVAALNAVRARHGLAPVVYDHRFDDEAAATALVMAVRGELDHDPPPGWRCWSPLAARGAQSSNLGGGEVSSDLDWLDEDAVLAGWLRETDAAGIGHRRWLLSPFLTRVSYGRVVAVRSDGARTDATALKVFDFGRDEAPTGPVPGFIAFPFGAYPQRYFAPGDVLSFAVVADRSNLFDNDRVDFSAATITVNDGSQTLRVTDRQSDREPEGLANSLAWRVIGLRLGVRYHVTIDHVRGAPLARYDYDFVIEAQ